MKATNNLNMDLKEEIDTLNGEIGKLRIFKDDYDQLIKDLKAKMEKTLIEGTQAKQEELDRMTEERNKALSDISEMKVEHTKKMSNIKLLEMELEAKLSKE